MKRNYFLTAAAITLALMFNVQSVFAVTAIPNFPSCANPQGTVVASYADGTHGIVGSTDTHSGSDTVYQSSDITLTQCFCSVSGAGIQTDWWKAGSLTDDEIKVLESEGWTYVPNGTPWGLDDAFYLTSNSNYSCLSATPTPPPSNPGGPGDGKSDGHSDGGSSCPSCTAPPGQILSAETGDVLGLAYTGDSVRLYGVFVIAIISLLTGFVLLRRQHSR